MSSTGLVHVKKALERLEFKFLHKASRLEFTIVTLPSKGRALIDNIQETHFDLTDWTTFQTDEEIAEEISILYFCYGVKEFNQNKDIARQFWSREDYGPSNVAMLHQIKTLNPHGNARLNNLLITLAMSPYEFAFVDEARKSGFFTDIVKSLAGTEDALEAYDYCYDLVQAMRTIEGIARNWQTSTEQVLLILVKPIMKALELPEKLWITLPDPPRESDPLAPQVKIVDRT